MAKPLRGHSPARWALKSLPLPHPWSTAAAAILLLCCLTPTSGQAQAPSGTLMGTVMDQSNAVIPQASVTLKDENSGAVRRTLSNADGFFTIVTIPAGTYTVTVEARGFAA